MPDSSAISVRRVEDPSQAKEKNKVAASEPAPVAAVNAGGPRKLIRPRLPAGVSPSPNPARFSAITPLRNNRLSGKVVNTPTSEDCHAEVFYFQKQIHSQTPMIFVLEDGEQIEGQIEWYDRDAVKVRHGGLRTLIYKAAIKYLYKSSETPRI